MANLVYRQGTADDIAQITALTVAAYGQFFDILSKENVSQWKSNLGSETTYSDLMKTSTCFVAEDEGKIVGSGFIVPAGNPFKWFSAEWSYIRLLGVLPAYGGKGIGRKLTQLCIEHAVSKGEKTIALHTSEFQNAARHIYESMGFRKENEFDLFGKKYWLYTLSLAAGAPKI